MDEMAVAAMAVGAHHHAAWRGRNAV